MGEELQWLLAGEGGGMGRGKDQHYNFMSLGGFSLWIAQSFVKINCDLLHSHLLLVALFHMRPNMFFHRYTDFEMFCLDLPVEGLQLTQRAYQ